MEEMNKPTSSQIEVLMSDWLGNLRQSEEGNYTHAGRGGIRRLKESTVGEYLIGNVSSLDPLTLMKRSRQAATQLVNSIIPGRTEVKVGGRGSYHESGNGLHRINIASDFFDDSSLSAREKVGVMLGLASHEAAHAVYTDSKLKEKAMKKVPAELQELQHSIWNVIEDERIEYLLGEDRPGFAETLGTTKGYYYKKLMRRLRSNGQLPKEPLPRLLSTLAQAVRYPSEMTREEVEENFDHLDAIRRALTPFPLDAKGAWDATERIMDIVRDMAEESAREKQEQQKNDGGQAGPQGGPGQDGQDSQQNQENQDSNANKGGQTDGGVSEQQVLQAIKDALGTKEAQDVLSALKEDNDKSRGENASRAVDGRGDSCEREYVNDDSAEFMKGGPGDPRVFVTAPKGNAAVYAQSLAKVRRFIPAMSRALSCKSEDMDYCLKGLPSGKLNTSRLVSLKCGNTAIFEKQGTVTCSSASVCMLIDESGSMTFDRVQRAREAAILVSESIARIDTVQFYCYGYTSDELSVYSEKGKSAKWALSETGSKGGTPTGIAMKYAARRIRSITRDPVLMLVLTDGGADDTDAVIRQDQLLRTDGFLPVGVGIQTSSVRGSFKESIVLNDISTFALDLGRLVKGCLDKMLVRSEQ